MSLIRHSCWSIDAFALGNQKYGPEDGYRFARGEAVTHMGGPKVQLKQPLDFFMMTDHSEFMGAAPMFLEKGSIVYDTPLAKLVRDDKMTQAFTEIAGAMIHGTKLPGLSDPKLARTVWQKVVANAEKYNDPGTFTTFVAYEWTSLPGQANMHRNVIFRDTKVPEVPFTAIDSSIPEDLWTAMETWRGFGVTCFAISHNGNASLGKMFTLHDSNGTFIDAAYAERRNFNEPLHEAGQTKGVSMAHPMFSPNDDWANFELWNFHLPSGVPVPPLRTNYVREAWKMGLSVERIIGVNPYKFGVEGGDYPDDLPNKRDCGAAERLGVAVGGDVLSTPAGAFDIAGSFPLQMNVVGVLAPSGTPDDDVVFTDIKTTWVIEGLAHGHQDLQDPAAESGVLAREGSTVVANASVLSYTEITPDNIDSFHFHGDPGEFPVDAVIAVPRDRKSGIMLRGRYETEGADVQMLVPLQVIDALLGTVFAVRDSVVLGSIGVVLAASAITALVFALSIRLRRREIATIRKIGGPRRRLVAILSAEILMVVCVSAVIAAGMTLVAARLDTMLIQVVAQ